MLLNLLFLAISSHAAVYEGNPNIDYNEYDFNGMEKIRIVNTTGRITVNPMPVNRVTIKIIKRNFNERCSSIIGHPDISQAYAEVRNSPGENCAADIELHVPKGIKLQITQAAGDIELHGFDGSLSVDLGEGHLHGDGHFTNIEGKAGNASVDLSGLEGAGKLVVTTGPVKLSFVEDVKGQFDLNSGTGNSTLSFAKGSKIKASLDSGAGGLTNEVQESADSDFDLKVKNGTGNLQLKNY